MPDRLLIFCKAPKPGKVKTRLSPELSGEEAAALYEASLRDVVALAARERAAVELWCDSARSARHFKDEGLLPVFTQCRGTLGDRQRDAFERTFAAGAERVVIIGSDSPTMPESHLHAALDDLHDAPGVVGPARDGGYYLIGLHKNVWPGARALFDDIEWSTGHVFTQLLHRAATLQLELRVLPGWYDFDVPADLELLRADASPTSHVGLWLQRFDARRAPATSPVA